MKNLHTTLFNATLLVSLFAIVSCGQTKTEDANSVDSTEYSKEVAEERNDETFETRASEKDAQFLVNAAEIGMKEVKLAELALSKSTNADVKELATMMRDEHTKAGEDLKALAAKKGVTIPTVLTEDGEDTHKKLSEKEGKKFDKEYCDMMVKGHKDAIDKFEKASKDAEDADIKNWATTMLPTLRNHLEHSKTCKDKCDKLK